jgi:hypothetical protein
MKTQIFKTSTKAALLVVLVATLDFCIDAPHAASLPSASLLDHSSTLTPTKCLPGETLTKVVDADSTRGWTRVPAKLTGTWTQTKLFDSFTDAFDVDKMKGLPDYDKSNTKLLIGLRRDTNGNVWDSENINSHVDKFAQKEIIDRWELVFGTNSSMTLSQQKTSIDLDKHNTITRTILSESIVDFELPNPDTLVAKFSTKWFTPEGAPIAISRWTREYKKEAPFKDTDILNGADVHALFDAYMAKRDKK